MKEFSFQTRHENLSRLQDENFDILIIGGGITGAGVARDAALRGLKVALIETNDFASGTSSKSSKLIHGGIRYLENLDFKLVFEALSERSKLFEIAPNLVHPLRFMIPIFKDSRVGMFKMGLGMWLYDALSLFQTPEMHERLNANETKKRMPIVKNTDLEGSFIYSDAYMDDDRLVIETLRSAHEAGAVIVNFVEAIKSNLKDNLIQSVEVKNKLNNQNFKISCRQVISTTGPWTDLVGPKLVSEWKKILNPSKGIHLTLPKDRLPLASAVVMAVEKSNRIVFAIPRYEMVIIGTTETDFNGNPSDVSVTPDDVQYLLEVTNQYFPRANIKASDIVASYAGVRPLVKDDSGSQGKTSREHVIIEDERGFIFVAGGKYTTYRLMSEQIVDKIIHKKPIERRLQFAACETKKPLNHYIDNESYHQSMVKAQNSSEKYLATKYGMEAYIMIDAYGVELGSLEIEAHHAIDKQMCFNLVDFFARRTHELLAEKDHGLNSLDKIAKIFQEKIGWSNEERETQIKAYKDFVCKELSWRTSFNLDNL